MCNNNLRENKPLCIGILLNAIFLIFNQFAVVPDFMTGFIEGMALVFFAIGLYGIHHDISKIKNWKKTMIKNILKR